MAASPLSIASDAADADRGALDPRLLLRSCRWAAGLWGALLVSSILALPVGAAEPSLEALAYDWASGRYVSPVVCEVDGQPIAGGRYFELEIADARRGRSGMRLVFEDLDASEASRCFDDLGRAQGNIVGTLELVFRGRSRPGMALRDMREQLKRKAGFEYFVRAGQLALSAIEAKAADPPEPAQPASKSFRGASASVLRVRPASDDDRLLAGLRGRHRIVLEISGPSLPTLRIPAVRLGPAGQQRSSERR